MSRRWGGGGWEEEVKKKANGSLRWVTFLCSFSLHVYLIWKPGGREGWREIGREVERERWRRGREG